MKVWNQIERTLGQLITLTKSFLYWHKKVLIPAKIRTRKITVIDIRSFPYTYLGCPIIYGRKKKYHFEDLVRKSELRMISWNSRLLTYGGRYVLISNILQSLLIYLCRQ